MNASIPVRSASQRRVFTASNLNAPVAWGPLVIGVLLFIGAVALLVEDAIRSGHVTTQHCMQPLLALGAATAAIYAHRMLFGEWRLGMGAAFLAVAVLGSFLVVYGTMGRQADAREARQSDTRGFNAAHAEKKAELEKAKAERDYECRSGFKSRCKSWQDRVDTLGKELGQLKLASVDPRAEALGELATLVGFDGKQAKAIVSALDPIALPVWLELSSIVFLSCAFPARRRRRDQGNSEESEILAGKCSESVSVAEVLEPLSYTRSEALTDFRTMRSTPSQKVLADRWGVTEGTVSKWLGCWATEGHISRGARLGKERAALALPAPAKAVAGQARTPWRNDPSSGC